MTKTTSRVERVNEKISTRKRKLSLILSDLEGYQELVDDFDKWLKSAEKNIEAYKTTPFTAKEISLLLAKYEVCGLSVFLLFHALLFKVI